jgi:ATP-dependent RNA helicase DDX21
MWQPLIGSSAAECATQASGSVRHMMLPCHWTQRPAVTADLVRFYGAGGRTIVFTETKRDANEMADALGAAALHGDIPQARLQSCHGNE